MDSLLHSKYGILPVKKNFSYLVSHLQGADCCVPCFDLNIPANFKALDKWKDGFIANAGPDDPK